MTVARDHHRATEYRICPCTYSRSSNLIIVASPAQAPTRCKGFREALRGSEVAHVDSKKFCVVDGMEFEDEVDRFLAESNELEMIETNPVVSVCTLARSPRAATCPCPSPEPPSPRTTTAHRGSGDGLRALPQLRLDS